MDPVTHDMPRDENFKTLSDLRSRSIGDIYLTSQGNFIEPDDSRAIRESYYRSLLSAKLDEAKDQGRILEIRNDGHGDFLIDPSSNSKVIFDGKVTTPTTYEFRDGSLFIDYKTIPYSLWTALSSLDPTYRDSYGLAPLPYAGLGISVLPITTDDLVVLTVRGPDTPVYPGRFYGVGGAPKPDQNIEEIISMFFRKELSYNWDPHAIEVKPLAFVSDINHQGIQGLQRPEIVFYSKIDLTYDELILLRQEGITQGAEKPADVADLHQFHITDLSSFLKKSLPNEFCPPTWGALKHLAEIY